jgi:hypothetical protein
VTWLVDAHVCKLRQSVHGRIVKLHAEEEESGEKSDHRRKGERCMGNGGSWNGPTLSPGHLSLQETLYTQRSGKPRVPELLADLPSEQQALGNTSAAETMGMKPAYDMTLSEQDEKTETSKKKKSAGRRAQHLPNFTATQMKGSNKKKPGPRPLAGR